MGLIRQAAYLEKVWVCGEQTQDHQSGPGVATAADTAVVSELCIGLSCDDLGDHYGCPCLSLRFEYLDRPAMVAITAIECGDQEPGVGERAQPPYTVSSIVSERSEGP